MDYLHGLPRPVDAILITGDIADHGEVAEYETAARTLRRPRCPVLVCPGNHDVRAAYRKGLLGDDRRRHGPINARYDVAGAVFLLADSSIPGAGRRPPRRRDAGLARRPNSARCRPARRPSSPSTTRRWRCTTRSSTRSGCCPPSPWPALLAAHPQVVAVLTGHFHTAAASTFAGRPLLVAPGRDLHPADCPGRARAR